MDTEIGKPVNWDLPLMMRDGTPVQLVPGKFKFINGETRLVSWQNSEGYTIIARYFESGLYNQHDVDSDLDIINIPPTTQDAWVVKYADGSMRVLLEEPTGFLSQNPKPIKATLTYYDTP